MSTATVEPALPAGVKAARLVVGLEVHVELATRSKMFTRVGSPACAEFDQSEPNTLIDPVTLALPGALPVMNKAAVEMSMLVGLALNCSIAEFTKWDRKSYYYPDLPKGYQISQYDLPLCFDGSVDMPLPERATKDDIPAKRVGIIRAHLEEDAGKLSNELPGGAPSPDALVDFNRAGTPLLEVVTAPDFRSADEVVDFAKLLRNICRYCGVSIGIMQRGHMRFEPNINMVLELDDGREIKTPIVEIKNLNSFRALKGAIEYEQASQPQRFLDDGKIMGPGAKTTRGWNDGENRTYVQREKEDAHDYRYFPDPDLIPVTVSDEWREEVRARLPELPHQKLNRYLTEHALPVADALALVEERPVADYFDETVEAVVAEGITLGSAGKQAANIILQNLAKKANEAGALASELGVTPAQIAGIIKLRSDDSVGSAAIDPLLDHFVDSDDDAPTAAETLNLLQVRDEGQLEAWCDAVIADPANAKVVEDVRSGKMAAIGRLLGGVMKLSGGAADAKAVREMLMNKLV